MGADVTTALSPGPVTQSLKLLRFARGGAILCLHGLSSTAAPSWSGYHIAQTRFERLIRLLRWTADIIPLGELLDRHEAGCSTAGLIALTFDDAYASLQLLLPALASKERLPITVFATGHGTRRDTRFWWDRVDDLFHEVPAQRWRMFEDAAGLPDAYRAGHPAGYGPLRPFRQWMLAEHCGRCPDRISGLLDELELEVGFSTAQRAMTLSELAELARHQDVTIGIHTMTHPVLPLLGVGEMRAEIADCATILSAHGLRITPVLAIPFGLFDARVIRIASEVGMRAALTLAGINLGLSPRHLGVPRFYISAHEDPLKLLIKLSGVADRWRAGLRANVAGYPALPSPTT